MGVANVRLPGSDEQRREFVRSILNDLQALEYMIEHDWFETDVIRIGAEQEMCLVDKDTFKAAPINLKVLEQLKQYPWADTELAKFNLETNMTPRVFTGSAFSDMQAELDEMLAIIKDVASKENAAVLLTGILPTLRKSDLAEENLTPMPRYKALMQAINSHKLDPSYAIRLQGIDELSVTHESPLIEAANTSFQVHLQVSPASFVKMYNISQALTGPIMATAANSPLVFGRRLWHENRIALFQQALDTRRAQDHMREHSARVSFGKAWINDSILDIYREDLARFRLLLAADIDTDSVAQVKKKEIPKLLALQVHNSTVYRWNRPCYGISDTGKPHLRIENRVLPAGPTTLDEMANAALWLGSMVGMSNRIDDVRDHMSFEDASDNFSKAAQFGFDSKFNWFGDAKISAKDLLESEIIPMAREGLKAQGVDSADIDKYMGTIEERSKKLCTGARWQLKSFTKLRQQVTRDEALSNITSAMLKNQELQLPVHEWPLADEEGLVTYSPSKLKVEEFMETDFVTCEPDDLIDLISEMMDWRQLRYMPVEDKDGKLSGLVTAPLLLRYHVRKTHLDAAAKASIREIMVVDPITIGPKASIVEAMEIMRSKKIGSLPVTQNGELIGMITVLNLLQVTGRLIKQVENQPKK